MAYPPPPQNQKELQSFLGTVNYLSQFLIFLSDPRAPLQNLLKKDSEFVWTSMHQNAFDQLKLHVSNDVKLQFYDYRKPLHIEVDTSKKGIGVAMLQEDCIVQNTSRCDIPNNLRPISYASKTLSSTESNYSNIECELLGVLFATTQFKHFTYRCTVHVITDHKPLVSLFKKSLVNTSPHLSRMLMQVLDYTLNVCYQPGDKMDLSDALGCLSSHNKATGKTIKNLDISIHVIEEITGFDSFSVEKLRHLTSIDSMLLLLIEHINNGFPDSSNQCPDSIKPYFSFRDELSICNGLVLKGHNRVVTPTSLRRQAINLLHNKAHFGLNKTLERARSFMYWLGITDDIQSSISACKPCLTYSTKQQCKPYAVDAQVKPWT